MTDAQETNPPTRGLIYRSRTDRVIAGVAGGLAEYFKIDPVLTRLGFVLFTFAGGAGLLVYVIAWIIIPERPLPGETEPTPAEAVAASTSQQHHHLVYEARIVLGSFLILLGSLFLADKIFPHFNLHGYFWPMILIALGGGLILYGTRR